MNEQEALERGDGFRRNSWKAFVFVLQFLRPHLSRLFLVCLSDISIVLVNLSIPWFAKVLVDQAIPHQDGALATKIIISVALLLLLVYGLVGLRTFLYNSTEQLLQLGLRKKMYTHLQKLSLDTIESIPFGEHQFRVTTDSDRIAHMLVRILPTLTMLVEFALIVTAAIYVEPILTVIVLLFLIPWTALFVWVTHYGRILDRRRLRFCEMRDAAILQAATSFGTIKGAGRVRTEIRRTGTISVALQRISAQGYLILVGFEFATQKLIPYLKTTTIYLYLAHRVIAGAMTLGTSLPMIAYLGRLAFPIERIVNFGCWIWQTMVSAERMMQILQTEPAIVDRFDAVSLPPLTGRVELINVSFSRKKLGIVLDNVSIELRPGTLTAIVGPSGAGKSTLVNIILRLAEPISGAVLVNGMDLRELKRESFIHQVALVSQDTYIFNGSVRDNLLIARPQASDEEILRALRDVELKEWMEKLPQGLSQDLASGTALSNGQRQRIGIARAILANSRFVILDEPTSALDPKTEAEVFRLLLKATRDKTTLLVTHRLATSTVADEIIVMNQGRIVERGSHEELLNQKGLYDVMMKNHNSSAISTAFRQKEITTT